MKTPKEWFVIWMTTNYKNDLEAFLAEVQQDAIASVPASDLVWKDDGKRPPPQTPSQQLHVCSVFASQDAAPGSTALDWRTVEQNAARRQERHERFAAAALSGALARLTVDELARYADQTKSVDADIAGFAMECADALQAAYDARKGTK